MRVTPEQGGVGIVLVGSLNPAIFHPEWFRARELMTAEDLEKAEIKVILPELCIFSVPWAEIQIDRQRFTIQTGEDPFVRVHDLLMKTFVEQLPHTPLFQLGINRAAHFRVASREVMDKVGSTLAPAEAWGDWHSDILSGGEKHGGLRSLTMEQSFVKDRPKGCIRATVQPSVVVTPGIWVQVNDHYEVDPGSNEGSSRIVEILHDRFDESIARSEWIIDQVLRLI